METSIALYLMASVYIVGGLAHFFKPGFYLPLIPPFFPAHLFIVYASGVAEIALGAGVLWPASRTLAAWGIIAFLIAVMPVHIYMILERDGKFEYVYRWFLYGRPFIQIGLMYWAFQYTRELS